jgi:hypothetical protein
MPPAAEKTAMNHRTAYEPLLRQENKNLFATLRLGALALKKWGLKSNAGGCTGMDYHKEHKDRREFSFCTRCGQF